MQLQEIHDHIMREFIAKYHGYEIITEGDSFQVAFDTCAQAMNFCTDVQYKLLEHTWPKQVIRLNPCAVKRCEYWIDNPCTQLAAVDC